MRRYKKPSYLTGVGDAGYWGETLYLRTRSIKYMRMTDEERKSRSVTRIFKAIFPDSTNHYDTMFGGTAMALMDEVAFMTATRYSRKRVVTVSSDRINFDKPIPAGTIIELIGTVERVGTTSITIKVEIYIEQMYSNSREEAITGSFTMVAVDENKRPVSVR
jgi:acyl-CoA hydrolase